MNARPRRILHAAFSMAVLAGTAAPPARHAQAQGPPMDINAYADQCACELGESEGRYVPAGVMPSDAIEIPVYWNNHRITFEETAPMTGTPMPGSGHWEYLFEDPATMQRNPGVVNAYPDTDNATGRIFDGGDLKCDYWPHVETSCVPGQRVLQRDVGEVTWTFLFRRVEPPKPGQVAWDAFHPNYFKVMDVNGYNRTNGGVCWFDTVNKKDVGEGLVKNMWWVGVGEPPAPPGIPRPGGKDVAKQARATSFWDTPAQMRGQPCIDCHGNGPFLTSRWIDGFVPNDDDQGPYWNAAALFANPVMFAAAGPATMANPDGTSCGGSCHRLWSKQSSTCPGFDLAETMTSEPTLAIASRYRRQLDAMGMPLAPQNAGILFEMPDPYNFPRMHWEMNVKPRYDAMKPCCAADVGAVCLGETTATVPNFYGEQGPVPPTPRQRTKAPEAAAAFMVTRFNCVTDPDGSETCDYRVTWDDPANDYDAPDRYYIQRVSASSFPGSAPPSTTAYCPSTSPDTSETTLAGDTVTPFVSPPDPASNWRRHHEIVGSIAKCTKLEVRLCGGQCAPPAESRDSGRTTVIETACAPVDHYKCYKTRQSGFPRFERRAVTLDDQFGTTNGTVVRPHRFCNPVNKNTEGIQHPLAHLNCYKISEPRGPRRDVVVVNQFGEQRLTITRADTLCVPAVKNDIGTLEDLTIDHFKCYRVRPARGTPKFTRVSGVSLVDQFEEKATTVIAPVLLCAPVSKNGEDPMAPTEPGHLTCFKIRDDPGQPRFEPQPIDVTDQFAEEDLLPSRRTDCRRSRLLCVPSAKRLASPSLAFVEMSGSLLD